MPKTNKEALTEDILFQQQHQHDLKHTDSVFSLNDQLSLDDQPELADETQEPIALNENFVELNSNKHSFEKMMRKNIYELFRCFLFVYLIYYRTNILVPSSFYRAETRMYLKNYFTDYFKLEQPVASAAKETLLSILNDSIFLNMTRPRSDIFFQNYIFLDKQTIKIKLNLKEAKYSCNSLKSEFPYSQICSVIQNATNSIDLAEERAFEKMTYVYGAESLETGNNRDKGLFKRIWDYFNQFECEDVIDDTHYEPNCDGFVVNSSYK